MRPLVIGLIHGLAGTGALTSLVIATLPTTLTALLYLSSFGLGSMLGMALVTLTVGLSVQRMRTVTSRATLMSVTGLASMGYGLYWGMEQLTSFR